VTPQEFFQALDEHFLKSEERLHTVAAFSYMCARDEGWFRGEVFAFLTNLERSGAIPSGWRDEKNLDESSGRKGKRLDFAIPLDELPLHIEPKTLCLTVNGDCQVPLDRSPGKTGKRNITFYMGKNGVVERDVGHLARRKGGYCVLFVYPAPDASKWLAARSKLVGRMAEQDIRIEEDRPERVQSTDSRLYISKIQVSATAILSGNRPITRVEKR